MNRMYIECIISCSNTHTHTPMQLDSIRLCVFDLQYVFQCNLCMCVFLGGCFKYKKIKGCRYFVKKTISFQNWGRTLISWSKNQNVTFLKNTIHLLTKLGLIQKICKKDSKHMAFCLFHVRLGWVNNPTLIVSRGIRPYGVRENKLKGFFCGQEICLNESTK